MTGQLLKEEMPKQRVTNHQQVVKINGIGLRGFF